jgi:sugar lactone lactonase YvrE
MIVLAAALGAQAAFAAQNFPPSVSLPDGWRPEGIVAGRGTVIYSGSLADGGIYAADARTGLGQVLVAGQAGRVAVGLAFDRRSNYLFAAGGPTGSASVYDAATGAPIATFQLSVTPTASFINDVVVTRSAAYFTNSSAPVLYRLPLGPGGGLLPATSVETIPLSGDYQQVPGFNANGIVATADGAALIVVNSALGVLYQVDPVTGVATLIDLDGASLSNGDGMLLEGNTLYVVRNRLNQIEVIDLEPDLLAGTVVETITGAEFDVPSTITRIGSALYVVNARFGVPPTPDTPYSIIRVEGN